MRPSVCTVVSRRVPLQRHKGFTLIELSITLTILAILAIWQGNQFMREVNDAAAEATGTYLRTVKGALDNMIAENYEALSHGEVSAAGYASLLAPTLQELRAKGHLNGGFPDRTPFNQTVAMRLQVASTCPGLGCRIDAVAYATTPLKVGSDQPSYDLVGIAVMAAGGFGGASFSDAPNQIRGATFSLPNPVPSTPGIVAVSTNMDTTMFNQFVRVRDTRDPDLQGDLSVEGTVTSKSRIVVKDAAGQECIDANNTGVISINCVGRLNAKTGVFTSATGDVVAIDPTTGVNISRSLTAQQGIYTGRGSIFTADNADAVIKANTQKLTLHTATGPALALDGFDASVTQALSAETVNVRKISTPGEACGSTASAKAYSRDAAGSVMVCADNGRWAFVARAGRLGTSCAPNGSWATETTTNQGLVCRLGVWIDADNLLSSYVMVDTQLVSHGGTINKPSCGLLGAAQGTPLIYLIPSIESSKASAFTRQAVDIGSAWRVSLLDYDGTPLGGPAKALAHIYCKY